MIFFQTTHVGLVRNNNEDYIHSDDLLGIYLLADGMGGHNAGEVASELAVKSTFPHLSTTLPTSSSDDLSALLKAAILQAHNTVLAESRSDLMHKGMGTTLVIAVVMNGQVHICHVGDSRAYLFSPSSGILRQVTSDHTVADELLRAGTLTREQIPPQYWHTLTQAVGIEGSEPVPDYSCQSLQAGDMIMLCSDGLTDMLNDTEIAAILSAESSLPACTQKLLDAALANGGKDNVSIILIQEGSQ